MIRINLLPIKKARQRSAGRLQLAVFAVVLVLTVVVCAGFYLMASSQLSDVRADVNENRAEVQRAEQAVADAKKFQQDKERLEQQLAVLAELETKRTGPVRVLDELQAILSPPRNQEEKFAMNRKNWNPEWDTRRLWVQNLSETEGEFEMAGSAINADDVAEFLQRLTTANHFYDVQLDYVKARKSDNASPDGLVDFRVTGKISYGGREQAQAPDKG